ncbi:LytR C-terminal domain-containing protein [Miltoncostaea marina]|uniref:LytR C-terminal domain-containing protein n=1 Tax=Miltoncostaea marina TaxID=2843215 RepID=UPI001C3D3DFE|nr:LytR C-terminal domain-containing protein [Miltoncostaea marina]
MTTEPPTTPPPDPPAGARPWVRPVALVVACLVIGFVAGWIVRGDDGPVTVLAPAGEETAAGGDGGSDGPATSTAPATTAARPPAPPPDRADIALAVLNGTNENGAAARTAGQAESLGYSGVTTGNAPTTAEPTTVYFRPGRRPAATRVGRDLEIDRIRALPRTGAVGDAAPDGAQVVVVLGTG